MTANTKREPLELAFLIAEVFGQTARRGFYVRI